MPRKASGSRLSSTECRVSATVTAISGRLTQKIARQEMSPDQGAAAGRAEHGRDPGPGGPGADRLAPRRALEGGGDDRQRARHQQRPGDSLQGAGADQELDRGRDRAERRGGAEGDQAVDKHAAAAELIAERAADQQQRDQGQHVGLDHPLLPGKAGVEAVADRRQRHVDHGRVEEDDRRAEDRRDQRQALLAGHAIESTWDLSAAPRHPIANDAEATDDEEVFGESYRGGGGATAPPAASARPLALGGTAGGGTPAQRRIAAVPLRRHLARPRPTLSRSSSGSTGQRQGRPLVDLRGVYQLPAVARRHGRRALRRRDARSSSSDASRMWRPAAADHEPRDPRHPTSAIPCASGAAPPPPRPPAPPPAIGRRDLPAARPST